MRSGVLCYIFPHVERALVFCDIFSACGTRSGIFFFSCMERALVFCVIFFRVCNALWYFVLYFSMCVTFSGIVCCIFPRVKCALVFCVIYFPFFSSICVLLYLACFPLFFSLSDCLKLSLIYALCYCRI